MDAGSGANPEVSIIIPARNEEACLGDCLASLVSQTGVAFEIIVVDDLSTDRTRAIAEGFAGVRVIPSPALPAGWTGKNNAVVAGAKEARGSWLLFTDADTVHVSGSLARALAEAKEHGAELLSYSPEQTVVTLAEKAVMPVVFAALAAKFPPAKVRDPNSGIVAANGQYILVRRAAYESVGGHAAAGDNILEDVALARAFRAARHRVYFRYGAGVVRTRMYRSWRDLREGWTKNLALLFPHPIGLALFIASWWAFAWITLFVGLAGMATGYWRTAYYVLPAILLYMRIARANFRVGTNLVAVAFGSPVVAYLLVRSRNAHAGGGVVWKGRTYTHADSTVAANDLRPLSGPHTEAIAGPRP